MYLLLGQYFALHQSTGELTLISRLDYEKSSERKQTLYIVTKNRGHSARVFIHVKDVNDCAPKFDQTTYIDYVPESAPIGSTVLKLHASDDDSGLNADILYSINSREFIVDSYTGVISTADVLDFEVKRVYTIPVMAHDRGRPSLSSEAKLIVHIVNVNDNMPVFTSQEYSCTIWENAGPGTHLTAGKIEA